jgi:hypothetical protein
LVTSITAVALVMMESHLLESSAWASASASVWPASDTPAFFFLFAMA